MSIYATQWILRFPAKGDDHTGCDWVEVMAQAVPGHIGTGYGYKEGDPYGDFLPPPLPEDQADRNRAVVIVVRSTHKGTDRSPEEYGQAMLTLSGEEYERIEFWKLHEMICDKLRSGAPRVVVESFKNGSWWITREDGSSERVPFDTP